MPSSSASHETIQAATQSAGGHGPAQEPPKAWFFRLLDGFLSEHLRRAPPAELSKARVVAGASLLMLPIGLLFLPFSIWMLPNPWLIGSVTLIATLGQVSVLVLLRRASITRTPALVLCGSLAIAYLFTVLGMNVPYGGIHIAGTMGPLLAIYLLGWRIGFAFAAAYAVLVAIVFPSYFVHAVANEPSFWGLHLFAATGILGTCALGMLNGVARDEAQSALERTMKELRESQQQMSSLIESTNDIVFSVDAKGRMLILNQPARRAFQKFLASEEVRRGESFFNHLPPAGQEMWRKRLEQAMSGRSLEAEDVVPLPEGRQVLSASVHPIIGEDGKPAGATVFARDITARVDAEAKLAQMHRNLIDVSRQAGMAEMAVGVLHNVGNTLNSINISAALLGDGLRGSRVLGLAKATGLMKEHAETLGDFLGADPQGRKLPAYLFAVTEQLLEERDNHLAELKRLTESVEHIKSIVSMQQEHARLGGVVEQLPVPQLIDEALRLSADSFERLSIQVRREYEQVRAILVDRHKLLQILVNLLSNSRHALKDSGREDKVLTIRVRQGTSADTLRVDVVDNGVGIPPENLTRIFAQGFTTKKSGHGFGLHISALAAMEMGGTLSCESAGGGQGATFTLELPVEGPRAGAHQERPSAA